MTICSMEAASKAAETKPLLAHRFSRPIPTLVNCNHSHTISQSRRTENLINSAQEASATWPQNLQTSLSLDSLRMYIKHIYPRSTRLKLRSSEVHKPTLTVPKGKRNALACARPAQRPATGRQNHQARQQYIRVSCTGMHEAGNFQNATATGPANLPTKPTDHSASAWLADLQA